MIKEKHVVKKRKILAPSDFREYQWRAFWFAFKRRCSALFLDMGLGKTIIVLSIIKALKHRGYITKPVLLVGPIRVIYTVWAQEAALWSHTRDLSFSLVHGNERARLAALEVEADVYMVNPESLRWLLRLFRGKKARENFPFDMLIVDESSMFKAAGSKRFRTLRHFITLFRRRIILSGTPTPNNLLEIWPQMFIVDAGQRLGTSVERFKSRFFAPTDDQGYTYAPRRGAERYVHNLVKDVALSMQLEDWRTDIPPTVFNDVFVELPPAARRIYDRLEEEMFAQLEAGDVEAFNAATLTGKCHQIANGAIYSIDRETQEKIWEPVHRAKLDALHEIISETGSPVLVAYHFKHDIIRLRDEFPLAGIFSQKNLLTMEDEWNQGLWSPAFAHRKTTGHGSNLQYGPGHTIAEFSLTWSWELHVQFVNRIGGARAQRPVMVHRIIARDTVDEAIVIAMRRKATGNRELMNSLNEYRRNRRG